MTKSQFRVHSADVVAIAIPPKSDHFDIALQRWQARLPLMFGVDKSCGPTMALSVKKMAISLGQAGSHFREQRRRRLVGGSVREGEEQNGFAFNSAEERKGMGV